MKPSKNWKSTSHDLYQEVTDKIIAALEAGVMPWQRGWDQAACGGPMNPTTGRSYRGINNLILGLMQVMRFNGDPRWCSYRQAQAKRWQVRKGERGTTVVFYKRIERKEDASHRDAGVTGKDSFLCLLRGSIVFHASQIDGFPDYVPLAADAVPWRTPDAVEIILAASGADIRYGGSEALFLPATDHIQLPPVASFKSPEAFAHTALHELGHFAAAKPQLDISEGGRFGSEAYAMEELVVSLAADNVCAVLGIAADLGNTASYVESWLNCLRQDKRAIFRAASSAQRIADYILGLHPAYAASLSAGSDLVKDDDEAADDLVAVAA